MDAKNPLPAMPNAFNFTASPFDCLTPGEQRTVRESVDIAYFAEGATLLEPGDAPSHLFVLIKGVVAQLDDGQTVATYGPDECFDGRALVAGRASHRFVALEEVVAYELQREAVMALIAANATFGALLFADIGAKLSALAERHSQHQLHSLTLARVDEAFLRPPLIVNADTSVLEVVRLFQSERATSVLVRDTHSEPARTGIFTTNALQRAVLDGRPLHSLPVGEMSNFALVTMQAGDQLGDAMALMLKKRIHRVVVLDGERIVGVLEALDLFSFLSNHSHMITVRIEQASDLPGLAEAAAQITRLIRLLQRGGTRVALIAQLVQQLNARLFERAWQMIAPPALQAASCLVVMGSEGRGEQLLKTDQDNALILRDGYAPPADLGALCDRFSDALASFGYPPCPGQIMLSNPAWRGSVSEFSRRAREWLLEPSDEHLMRLAIFMDAHAVAGDAALLDQVRSSVAQVAHDNDALLARFAAAVDAFGHGSSWWGRLLGRGDAERLLDLKKEGIFPIVHGARSLAFAQGVAATSTADRVAALVQQGVLDAKAGDELVQSLHLLMGLKLKAGLAELDAGKPVSGAVDTARLTTLERDLLKDALAAVKRFKAVLRQRFRLDTL